MPGRQEQRFIQALDQVEFLDRDLDHVIGRLQSWLERLSGDIRARQLSWPGLRGTHALAVQAAGINAHLLHSLEDWAGQWAVLKPAQALADTFDDKVMLLVFGKFNAGKSSFCNFLAERFSRQGRPVRYFQVESGRLVESSQVFKEGSTETTAQLQGVVLGEKLLLLDTPGLHSVTPENAALTQRYSDSADGVLWLTSSTSPGQVQELDELARELRRNKPLLPVVTRSDFIDEDEIEGEICKVLCNKSAENRELQEQDVHARAEDKLRQMQVDLAALRPPVSISCHVARSAGQTPEAMRDAGFDRLYEALSGIVGPALRYKQRQPAEMLLHHFEENVLGGVQNDSLPRLAALISALQAESAGLEQCRSELARKLWREVAPALPQLMQDHAPRAGLQAVCEAVATALRTALDAQLSKELPAYVLELGPQATQLSLDEDLPGTDQPIAEADFDKSYEVLEAALRRRLEAIMDTIFEQCNLHVDALAEQVQAVRDMLQVHARRLQGIERELRA